MAAENSGVPWSATSSWNSAGRSERAMSTSAAGGLGGRTILVAMGVSLVWSRASAGGAPAPRRPAARTSAGYRSFFMSSGKFDVNEYDLTVPLALKRTDRSLLAVAEARRWAKNQRQVWAPLSIPTW